MLAVLAHTLMVLLGAAARELGLDRWLGASRIGGMSLFRMGQLIYDLIPRMKTQIFASVMKCYDKILIRHTVCQELLGVIWII